MMCGKEFPVALAMIQPEPFPGSFRHGGMTMEEIIGVSLKEIDMIQGILVNWDGVASLAVAAAGSDFIRVEHTYTGVEVGYAGMLEAQCVDICQFKKRIGTGIPVYADVQEVHYEQLAGKSIRL